MKRTLLPTSLAAPAFSDSMQGLPMRCAEFPPRVPLVETSSWPKNCFASVHGFSHTRGVCNRISKDHDVFVPVRVPDIQNEGASGFFVCRI